MFLHGDLDDLIGDDLSVISRYDVDFLFFDGYDVMLLISFFCWLMKGER